MKIVIKGFIASLLALVTLSAAAQSAKDIVIPIPNSVELGEGTLNFTNGFSVKSKGDKGSKAVASYLEVELDERFSLQRQKGAVELTLSLDKNLELDSEGYVMDIKSEGITISANSERGAFYGVQTLLQMISASQKKMTLSCQLITDEPRFSWRSYMLDDSRFFLGVDELKRMIDALVELKINTLHWHLTDDAAWRLEIKKYPLLTEVGSKRTDSEIIWWGSGKTSGKPCSGYYTQDDVREILRYARERYIDVVPEIEMPGHASAAVAAYPWLGTKGEKIDVPVKFGKHYAIFDVIDPRVQTFLQDVVSEVIELFECDVIHIGGDEVRFDQWEQDADMVAYKEKMGYGSFMDIQIEFTNKMSKFIEDKGVQMMGWNEILGKNLHLGEIRFDEATTKIADNVIVHFWKGDLADLVSAAEQGYKLVNSNHSDTYLDYTYKTLPLKRAYNFNPIPDGMKPEYHKNVIGLGCQMWREWVPSTERLHYQTFPRVAAISEVGWSDMENKEYDQFLKRLNLMEQRWKEMQIFVHEAK